MSKIFSFFSLFFIFFSTSNIKSNEDKDYSIACPYCGRRVHFQDDKYDARFPDIFLYWTELHLLDENQLENILYEKMNNYIFFYYIPHKR